MDANLFVGAWRLVSLQTLDERGDPTYPLGRDAVGLLTSTAAGYMCLAIMDPPRPAFASADRFAATAEELGAAGCATGRTPGAGRRARCATTSR